MPGFGSLAPDDWQDREALENLAAIQAAQHPQAGPSQTWFQTVKNALATPGRMIGSLASTPVDDADQGAMMPETTVNPLVKGALGAAAEAFKSGITAPGDAYAGKIPTFDAEGHTSPEIISRGFDTAALAGGASAAGTAERAAANAPGVDLRVMGKQLASDTQPGSAVAAAEHASPFHLSAETALDSTARKSGTGVQWLNELKRYGAKPEELDWRGAVDFLEQNANVPLTKAQVEQHLTENPFQLQAVDRTSMPESWKDVPGHQQHAVWDRMRDIQGDNIARERDLPDWYEQIAHHSNNGGETGLDEIFNPPIYSQYQLPGGSNYRERLLTLPNREPKIEINYRGETDPIVRQMMEGVQSMAAEKGLNYHSNHWEEPNIVVHRRSTDRTFEEPLTPEQETQFNARADAQEAIDRNIDQQHVVARQIGETAKPLEIARRQTINDLLASGKISPREYRERIEAYEPHPDLQPLQERLMQLRSEEDQLRKALPAEVSPNTSKSVHAEEIQSDWHQAGQKQGYGNKNGTVVLDPRNGSFRINWDDGSFSGGYGSRRAAEDAMAQRSKGIPDAPFKDSWHRLALQDMIREAAEKGADEISWTAGRSQPTNPKNLNVGGGAPNAERRAAYDKAEAGLVKHYDEKLVNAANKIGKPHGVQVERDTIPNIHSISRPGPDHDIFRMKVPQSLKDQALKKGFSLFEDTGKPAAAAAAASKIEGGSNVGQAQAAARDVAGRAGGGDASLAEAARAATRRAGAGEPLPGLPTAAMKIGDEHFVPGPIGSVRDVAKSYMAGRDQAQHSMQFPDRYHELDPDRARAIAKAFDEMKHDPNDPKVRASYEAMVNETRDQFRHLMKSGLKISPITPDMADPYAFNPRLAAKDVGDNNHLWFFPTEQGFGSTAQGGIDMRTHPMMQPSGEKLNGKPLLNNDLFRVVHDYFGHLKEGYGFRAAGEDNAWRSHAAMYSDLARPAMTTETRGQNSWVNYGPHGETNRKASAADTKYADQKVGLMPDWTMSESFPGKVDWQDALRGVAFDAPAVRRTNLVDERGLPIQGSAYTKEARAALDDIAKGPKGAGPLDLSTQRQVPGVPQSDLPRYEPPRGVSERMRDALDNPAVKRGIAASIKKGVGVSDWYHTEPVRSAFIKELGPQKGEVEFNRFMDTVAATSPRSDVPTNIRNASYYYATGSPENLPEKNPYPYGHVAQNLHRQNFETISSSGGWDPLQNPKPASFAENLRGNLQPVTVDTHAFRNIAMRTGDPRFLETTLTQKYKPGVNRAEDSMVKRFGEVRGDTVIFRPQKLYLEGKLSLDEAKNIPSFWATKPKENEYAAAEGLYRNLAKKAKLAPADAQAAAWAGAGDLTGLGTVGTHTFPELMNERIAFTARMRGESERKTLSDFIRGKKPLLAVPAAAGFGSLMAGEDRR